MQDIEREQMEFDVVIVGGGPSGLSAAIRLRQLAIAAGNPAFSVCIVEKGSEFGAHILSGAVLEPNPLRPFACKPKVTASTCSKMRPNTANCQKKSSQA